jgi:hypothetical protein
VPTTLWSRSYYIYFDTLLPLPDISPIPAQGAAGGAKNLVNPIGEPSRP